MRPCSPLSLFLHSPFKTPSHLCTNPSLDDSTLHAFPYCDSILMIKTCHYPFSVGFIFDTTVQHFLVYGLKQLKHEQEAPPGRCGVGGRRLQRCRCGLQLASSRGTVPRPPAPSSSAPFATPAQAAPLGKMSCDASSSTSPERGSFPPAAILSPRTSTHAVGSGSSFRSPPRKGRVLADGAGPH